MDLPHGMGTATSSITLFGENAENKSSHFGALKVYGDSPIPRSQLVKEIVLLSALDTSRTSWKGELSNVLYSLMILVICPGAYVGQQHRGTDSMR